MALNFPDSPSDGDTYEGYVWNDTVGAWQSVANDNLFAPKFLEEKTTQTADYTLDLTDINKVVPMNGTDLTLTIPTNASVEFPVGSIVNIYNINSTDVTIEGDTGVTVRNAGALGEFGEVSLRKRATDEWVLAGNVS